MTSKLFTGTSIPDELDNASFHLEPLQPEHVQLDYIAVMRSRLFLNRWSMSSWPAENFTLQENLADLEWHAEEHGSHTAFTYTVLSKNRQECLGCLYINPIRRIQPVDELEKRDLLTKTAFTRFWVLPDLLSTDLAITILKSVANWFNQDWPGNDMLFSCNQSVPELSALYQSVGFTRWKTLTTKGRDHLLWIA